MENYIERAINSPENPYGKNAYRIQQEAESIKYRRVQRKQLSNLEANIDFSKYI